MNITFVCNEYPPRAQGGIGTFVYYFGRELQRRGHNVSVAEAGDCNREVDDNGIRVVSHACPSLRSLDSRRKFAEFLRADAKANNTHVVEVPEYDGMLPFEFDACPVVVRLHQSSAAIAINRRRLPVRFVYQCERRTLAHHRKWIAVSQYVLGTTKRCFLLKPQASRVIYNFAPPRKPDAAVVSQITERYGDFILYAGKLTEGKGALDLARSARLFLAAHRQLQLVYVGQDTVHRGRKMSDCVLATAGRDLSSRVHFVGVRPQAEVTSWMAAARVYVQPSHLEAFSVTALEAMNAGVPIVFSSRSSGPELISHRVNGLLAEPADATALAEAVTGIVTDPEAARRFVAAARATLSDRFSAESCASQSLEFYVNSAGAKSIPNEGRVHQLIGRL